MTARYSRTERLGVNAVERTFLELGWIFREQHTTDVGIDAQVEICEAGEPTGRIIALQIKSGVSYFYEETPDAYVFRGSLKHLEYWLKHSLPVVLVLYDPTRDSAWWCLVNEAAELVRHEKGWSACVPKNQQLDTNATLALKSIAMPNPLNHARLQEIASRYSQERSYGRFPAILDALHAAEESIDVISPFLDETLFLALAFCSHRVRVRLLTGPEVPKSAIKEFQTGDHESIEWKVCAGCHSKLIVIDNFITIAGSANLTLHAWRDRLEVAYLSSDERMTISVTTAFESLWSGQHALVTAMKDLYDTGPKA
jgi:phosphatidylserine/phosphatidylglycerophosphate/cardiolipin synthase-like enzyme